jgi:hypothetical protein
VTRVKINRNFSLILIDDGFNGKFVFKYFETPTAFIDVSNHYAYQIRITTYTKNFVQGNYYNEMIDDTTHPNKPDSELLLVVVISIIFAVAFSIALIAYETQPLYYSTLAIKPESYNNFPDAELSACIIEIQSFEKDKTVYSGDIYINGIPTDHIDIVLNPGEVYEGKKIFDISGIQLPAKVQIELKTPSKNYSAHYWLKNE